MSGCRRASSATPTRLWLMTAVGPPPCATRILCDIFLASLAGASGALARSQPRRTRAHERRRSVGRAMSRPRKACGLETLEAEPEIRTAARARPAAQVVGRVARIEAALPHLSVEVARRIA